MSRKRNWMRWLATLPVLALLPCCTAEKPSPVVATCYPVTPWTAAQEDAQGTAYDALSAGSPLRPMIDDYVHLRAALRACAGVSK